MANICNFTMYVKGNNEDIESFYNALVQEGDVYMGRGAEAEIRYEDNAAFIDGWCKWSVQSALVHNAISMRTNPEMWAWGNDVDSTQLEFVTLFEACREWNLDMEVYSEEPGCEFQEHYICLKGDVVCDECVEYHEYDIYDYEIKEEAEEELGIEITDDEWDKEDYIYRGGFENWDFEI